MRTLRIYSQQLSYISHSSVSYHHVVHYLSSTYLSYYWKFVPFDYLPPILPSPKPSLLVTTHLISFSMSVVFVLFCAVLFSSPHVSEITQYLSLSA